MINNKLEDTIKSSLENYEIPYDESAWTAMSAKLDKVKPVKEPFLAKPKNWIIISASLVTITSITLFFVLDSNQPTKKSVKKSNTSITPNLSEEKNEQIKITESGPSTKRKIDDWVKNVGVNQNYFNLNLIWQEKANGKGSAVREGLKVAKGDVITIFDGDQEYDINDLSVFVSEIEKGNSSFVLGNRHSSQKFFSIRTYPDQKKLEFLLNFGHWLLA
jgi:cellulose synthase/poly-beta-1,6-N-acetylglucosamine synthase-like glycosyltransferase